MTATNRIPFRRLGIDADGDAHGTEGPWVYDGRQVRSTLPRTGMRPAGDPFPLVARLASTFTTSEVDGYTIAAAPDLLAACEAARAELRIAASYADETGIAIGLRVHAKACAKALAVVDAAIAKAKGEQL